MVFLIGSGDDPVVPVWRRIAAYASGLRANEVVLQACSLSCGASGCWLEPSQAGDSEVIVEFAQVVAGREQVPFLSGVVQAS